MNAIPTYVDLMRMIKRRWFLVAVITALFVLIAIIVLQLSPRLYTTQMIVGPTASDGVAGRGNRLTLQSTDSPLYRGAPVELDKDESLSDFSRFIELITSQEITRRVIRHHPSDSLSILQKLFADQWDAETQSWRPPGGVISRLKRAMNWLGRGGKTWVPPSARAATQVLDRNLLIEPVGTSAMRRIVYRHSDRQFGIDLLNALYDAADEHLRDQAKRRTRAEIDYIQRALQNVTFSEHRRALANLLAAQEQTQMMISVDLPFAADQIESAHAPELPDWPPVIPVIIVAFFAGLLIAISVVYILETAEGEF